ncbi:MAG TPA: DUF192 domain-containing protein [Candidatus Paceibacterota bacterium]|nr:DUF192 domain-containing protein [Candidatus Paceibacterota bacterium]
MNIVLFANNDLSRAKGLMFHRPLLKRECAFFNFPAVGKHAFWNKNVDFPISLVFCGKDGTVKDVKTLEAQQRECVSSENYDIKYVIETHIEAPSLYKIKKGSIMKLKDKEILFCDRLS